MILPQCFLLVGDPLTRILEEKGFLWACSFKANFTNLIVCFFPRISTTTTTLGIFSLNRYSPTLGNNLTLDSSRDLSDPYCIGKLILTTRLLFKIARVDEGGLLLDERLSPIGFGGMKSNDSIVEMHDCQTHSFYIGMPHFGILQCFVYLGSRSQVQQ